MADRLLDFDDKPFKVGDKVLVAIGDRIYHAEVRLARRPEIVVETYMGLHVIKGWYPRNSDDCKFDAVGRPTIYMFGNRTL
ncbi:hypothetical protein [Kitasatospora sp. NPDC090091]|uniref:hypothetical protein n=1 Tax=Kitasatospora sp. NPDC090091 TaxID=3364081 RepID=UPI0037FE94EF